MCGIVGIVSEDAFTSEELLRRLKRLEYRGYDSYGYWNGTTLRTRTGRIIVQSDAERAKTAISHTRWATHGGVTERNAHPHRAGRVTIVHNGIIENWREFRGALEDRGRAFSSETDSELIAHYVDAYLDMLPMTVILERLIENIRGTFAALIMVDGDERLYAAKRDSPLALGLAGKELILASDIYAFCDKTDEAIFFENDEYAVLTPTSYAFFKAGSPVEKRAERFDWKPVEEGKASFDHYMHKEIHEQPAAAQRLLASLSGEQRAAFDRLATLIKRAKRTVFTACGTAYHASLLGASLLHQRGVQAQAIIASEFESFVTVDDGTLVVAVSQSGETMDVVEALKYARENGATVASIVNVPYSTVERMSDASLHIAAGQEVAVASKKAFTNQCLVLLALAEAFGYPAGLGSLPDKVAQVLALEDRLERLASELRRHEHLYVLGRRLGYPVAREIALKIKEVSYVHAEGMMGGELKHGTIALIEPGTPVVALVYDGDPKMRANAQEVAARGARVITLGTKDEELVLPASSEAEFMLLAAVAGQLLAYHIAKRRGLPIDKPRNLAKSVTVL